MELIGQPNPSKAIERIQHHRLQAVAEWRFDFLGHKLLVLWNRVDNGIPIVFHSFDKDEVAWVLGSNPRQWRFFPQPIIKGMEKIPSQWSYADICLQIGQMPSGVVDEEEIDIIRRGHYKGLSLWLLFDGLKNSQGKDTLRQLLYTTDLIHLKPWADYARARRAFARQIFPYSELAQRGQSEEHLWLCMEYSSALQKLETGAHTKSSVQQQRTEFIAFCRNALNKAMRGEVLCLETIDDLVQQGVDWRLHIETLLIYEAIRLVASADGDSLAARDMNYHTRQFLNAIAHHNGMTHHPSAVILTPQAEGTVSKTKPGRPRNQLKRGRGRPPKGKT